MVVSTVAFCPRWLRFVATRLPFTSARNVFHSHYTNDNLCPMYNSNYSRTPLHSVYTFCPLYNGTCTKYTDIHKLDRTHCRTNNFLRHARTYNDPHSLLIAFCCCRESPPPPVYISLALLERGSVIVMALRKCPCQKCSAGGEDPETIYPNPTIQCRFSEEWVLEKSKSDHPIDVCACELCAESEGGTVEYGEPSIFCPHKQLWIIYLNQEECCCIHHNCAQTSNPCPCYKCVKKSSYECAFPRYLICSHNICMKT